MAKRAPPSEVLIKEADKFASNLLKTQGSGNGEGAAAPLDTQIDTLVAVTKYLQVRNKIAPDPEEQNDWVSRARDSLGGGAPSSDSPPSKRRSRRAPTPPAGAEPRDGADAEQFSRPGTPAAVSLPNGSTGPTSSEA